MDIHTYNIGKNEAPIPVIFSNSEEIFACSMAKKGHQLPIILQNEGFKIKVMKVLTWENISESNHYYDFYKNKGIDVGFFMVKQVEADFKPTA